MPAPFTTFPIPTVLGATGANPTATAGPVAVNGTAATFMTSDSAPAVQLGSASQKGIVQVDGSTITASAGVISSTGATAGNPTATAGPAAVNGSAGTFMRSDAAPAVQLGSNSQKGLVQVDGTTITASGGTISAVVPTAANPTAIAKNTAVNGAAGTFMRSDAAPAVQVASTSQLGLAQADGKGIRVSSGIFSSLRPYVDVVADFGADNTGATDAATAIQNAINSLPNSGGYVLFPPGIYRINSTIVIGNGSSSTNSTQQGVNLIGMGGSGDAALNAYAGSVVLRWNGGGASVLQFLGPMGGWGVQNITIDGVTLASPTVGLEYRSCQRGFVNNLTVFGASTAGILGWTWDPISGAVTFGDAIHNTFVDVNINVPAVSNAKGVFLTNGLNVPGTVHTNVDYNTFINLELFLPNSALTTYGLYLKVCDTNTFYQTHLIGVGAGNVGVAFDYSINQNFPNNNRFYQVDNSMATQWSNVATTPAGNAVLVNEVFGLSEGNGGTIPNIPNLCVNGYAQIGYFPASSGIGNSVTQITSITTAVTINTICGQITTVSNTFTAGTTVQFAVNNTSVAATDTIIVSAQTGSCFVGVNGVTSHQFTIAIDPLVNATSTVVINYAIIKAVAN